MTLEDFPDVRCEPTSYTAEKAEEIQCPECGAPAGKLKRTGGISAIICRNCRTGLDTLQRQSNYGTDWQRVRQWVLERDGRECRNCSATTDLHVHHIEKLVWFETTDEAHTPENLLTLCESCHRSLEGLSDPL